MSSRINQMETCEVVRTEAAYRSADRLTVIHAMIWRPRDKKEKVRGIVQICHGMSEYKERYDDFACFLASHGFLVACNDHLGHGDSVVDDSRYGYFAKKDGNGCLIADIHRLRTELQRRYPEKPYLMLGHSMGSFLLRQYITLYGEGLSGAVIMGTGSPKAFSVFLGMGLCQVMALFRGWHHRSRLLVLMTSGAYNRQFKHTKTPVDWLSKVESVSREFCSNPRSSFSFTLNGYYNMFRGIRSMQRKKNMRRIPKSLPLLLVSGAEDPVGDNGRGVIAAYQAYAGIGVRHIQGKLYKNDRHEILNESDRETVYRDILRWLEKCL